MGLGEGDQSSNFVATPGDNGRVEEVPEMNEYGEGGVMNGNESKQSSEKLKQVDERIVGALEALLFVASDPLPLSVLSDALEVSQAQTYEALRELIREYGRGRPRGFEIREVAGGWRMYTNSLFADTVATHVTSAHSGRLSTAALETLAVIAYRQPVTRSQISAIRGVSVDSVVRTLQMRGFITEIGTTAASGAVQYGTTPYFLEAMGMNSLAELEPLAPYLPEAHEVEENI